ncbi:MAG TPA: LPS assembly lipoprotein LptE [Candidatus Acidoferrum sp.]|nr:LPS assembly lipoprotein LptE [Candidatus Acidoferrum sp.]
MSWSRLLLCLILMLAGCGYHPLYGRHGADNASSVDEMALIRIEAIPDRIGQQMYNMLRERLNPYGKPEQPKYALSIALTETHENLFLEKDETATRANLTLKASFILRRLDDNSIVVSGSSRSVGSYDILSSQFASVVSEEDARERTARAISDDIRTRLALALQPRESS